MKIFKKWKAPVEAGQPTGWFETTLDECLKHTKQKTSSVLKTLSAGNEVFTPFARYKGVKNPHAVALGRLGGLKKSPKKTLSNRLNGRQGGRPKKTADATGSTERTAPARRVKDG